MLDPDADPTTDDAWSADAPLSIADDDFTIAVGTGDAVQLTGDYDTGADLVDAINSKVAGASAWVDSDNHVVIASSEDLTVVTANDAATMLAGVATTAVTDDTSFLTAISVESAGDANDTIVRVDAALTSVSSLRSTLGAIQNRFESTITNLHGCRRRTSCVAQPHQDADFAKETAALTRAQILSRPVRRCWPRPTGAAERALAAPLRAAGITFD